MKLHSLRYRIAATIFVLEAIMMTVVLWVLLSSSFETTREQYNTSEMVALQNLSELGHIALLTDEYNDLQPFLETAVLDPHVLHVLLTNEANIIYASSDAQNIGEKLPALSETGHEYWRSIEITNATGTLGTLWINFSSQRLEAAYYNTLKLGIGIALFGMIIIAFAGIFTGILLTRRLDELSKAAVEFSHGNFSARVNVVGDDEIGALGHTLNQMAEDISNNIVTLSESEQRFRTIFKASNDAVLLIDYAKDKFVDVNSAACAMLGYDFNELLRVPVSHVHSNDMSIMQKFISDVLVNGSATTEDLTCRTKSNSLIAAGISASKIIIDGNELILAQVRNITERKRMESELAASESLFRTLVESSPIAVCQTDFYGNCIYVNEMWQQQTGLTLDDCLGHGWHKAIYAEERDEILQRLQKNALKQEPWDLEYRFCKPDGSMRWLIGRIVALRDTDNRVTGYLVANLDITEHKQTEEALRRSQKMDAIGQLSGGIAHDFNNILAAILGSIEMLELQTDADEKTQKRFDTIKHSAQRAVDLTKQILGFSRSDSASLKVTNINRVIESMQTLMTHSLTPQVEVEYLLSNDLGLTEIDPGDFEDALLNLVLNARDAMDGRGRLTIETKNIHLDEDFCSINPEFIAGQYIQLIVSDNGKGIPAEIMDRIFEPFFTTKEQGKGTGLGMAMVFGFVKRSRGNIKVHSEPGMGTTFIFYLPRVAGNEDSVIPSSEPAAAMIPGQGVILVVDDEPQLLDLIEESLLDQGFTVLTAQNGAQAIAILSDNPDIDVLFSDVVMPGGMNGYELAESAIAAHPELKILLTSGYSDKATAEDGQARFKLNLLSKPYSQREMITRLRALLE